MNDATQTGIHWSFWLVGIFALLWNGLGSVNYLSQMNAALVATLPDTHQAIIIGRPIWATTGFAIAVFGGSIGALLMLLRKSSAFYLFVASLLGVLMTMVHTLDVATHKISFSGAELFVMMILPIVVALLLASYVKNISRKGWLI